MKTIIFIASLFIIQITSAQTPASILFEKHSGQEGFTSIYITHYMFDLFAKIANDEEDKEFHDITSKLKSIKILTVDSAFEGSHSNQFLKEIDALIKGQYNEMMIIKDGKETVKFLVYERNDKISEFLMYVYGESEPVLIFIEGEINLKDLSKLSKTMDVKGFEHLEDIDKNK
ncbi:MAG: DUF4252 domain-containing protein [Bacteroidales bacterium]|nr:DUF4252 domain-containing protein [Bacteroidales bacterium]